MTEPSTDSSHCSPMGPTEHHARLAPFAGTFNAHVSMWMGPGEPHVSTGTMVNSIELGGRFIEQRYKGHDTDGPFPNFEGRGWWGYNTLDNRYEGMWIDNATTMLQIEHGRFDDARSAWIMDGTMTNPETGQPMAKRTIVTLEDDDHHSMEMYFSTPDGREFKAMEIRYTRA